MRNCCTIGTQLAHNRYKIGTQFVHKWCTIGVQVQQEGKCEKEKYSQCMCMILEEEVRRDIYLASTHEPQINLIHLWPPCSLQWATARWTFAESNELTGVDLSLAYKSICGIVTVLIHCIAVCKACNPGGTLKLWTLIMNITMMTVALTLNHGDCGW